MKAKYFSLLIILSFISTILLAQVSPNLRSSISAENYYAVILSGGEKTGSNDERFWNECSEIYKTLINVYGYSRNNIYVLMSDGIDPVADRHLIRGGFDSSPLDLDGDGYDDIQYAATKNNITTIFDILSNILTPDDFLFIFTTDHGKQTASKESTLELWYDTITASEFALEVDKINAGEISIVMGQCHSGGFIPYLAKEGRTIATACAAMNKAYARAQRDYSIFLYNWITAVTGQTPYGVPANADYNNDGYVSMKEAFDYAEVNDYNGDVPQYSSMDECLGYDLTLRGRICSTTNVTGEINDLQSVADFGDSAPLISVILHHFYVFFYC